MKAVLIFICTCCLMSSVISQNNTSFCRAVKNGNFDAVERKIKKEIRKRHSGTQYYNGPGSGMQVTHVPELDSIVKWLKRLPCVEDAFWDKCQAKPAIYPGWSVIGAKFKTETGITERCFHIQEGTTGNLYIFGWKPHIFRCRNILIYKKMHECDGFVVQQKLNCK